MMKILSKSELPKLLRTIQKDYKLAAPVRVDGVLTFREFTAADEVELCDELAYQSPKEFLFPRVEQVLRFAQNGDVVDCAQAQPTVILGVHPCDLEAAKIMTTVFTTGRYADPYFAKRREQTVLVGLGCKEKKKGCFCDERGIDKAFSEACDVFLTEREDSYLAQAVTETGEQFLSKWDLPDAQGIAEIKASIPDQPILELHASESDLFGQVDWDVLTEKCQGCGMCTYICPTCHCFEFRDVAEQGETVRYKCWDSCMYAKFTMHASGHNPRATRKERFRQRVAHKYLYVKQNFGAIACTGCGRCIRSCPAGMNIKNVVKRINADLCEKQQETGGSER